MRTITITDSAGSKVGTISETDGGQLSGEGKGTSLLEQAPTKTFQEWLDSDHHSKYLRYVEDGSTS